MAEGATATAGWQSRGWLAPLLVLMVGSFLPPMDSSIVNVAIAYIQKDLGGGADDVAWVSTAYSLGLAVFVPTSNWLALAVLAGLFLLPNLTSAGKAQRFDWLGFLTIGYALAALVIVSERGQKWHWGSYPVLILIVSALLSMALFVVIENEVEYPLINLQILRSWPFVNSLLMIGVLVIGLFAMSYYLPVFLENVQGYGAADTGMLLLPQAMLGIVLVPIVGRLYDRVGARWLAFAGLGDGHPRHLPADRDQRRHDPAGGDRLDDDPRHRHRHGLHAHHDQRAQLAAAAPGRLRRRDEQHHAADVRRARRRRDGRADQPADRPGLRRPRRTADQLITPSAPGPGPDRPAAALRVCPGARPGHRRKRHVHGGRGGHGRLHAAGPAAAETTRPAGAGGHHPGAYRHGLPRRHHSACGQSSTAPGTRDRRSFSAPRPRRPSRSPLNSRTCVRSGYNRISK